MARLGAARFATDGCVPLFGEQGGDISSCRVAEMEAFLCIAKDMVSAERRRHSTNKRVEQVKFEGKSCILCNGVWLECESESSPSMDSGSSRPDSEIPLLEGSLSSRSPCQSVMSQLSKTLERQHEEELRRMLDECSKNPAGFATLVMRRRSREFAEVKFRPKARRSLLVGASIPESGSDSEDDGNLSQ
eukprot:TRINITY_DN22680_c0_g2_i1.p1 TRINITY_DN22680_c0_g2~~TRINITY_DN22680_c0_g2_i1.p1  ORF type:complete len:189 (-),score=31.01 TRINITY_DN22680_c0_g2_i1:158-724(-)